MIRWIDVGEDAHGVIAFGQIATGVIAVGQMATGVIAVGQVARGLIAVGQGAVGLIAIGQGAIGVFYGVGMVGVGGRGFGIVLPTVPQFAHDFKLPEGPNWRRARYLGDLKVELEPGDGPEPRLARDAAVRLDSRLRAALEGLPEGEALLVRLGDDPGGPVIVQAYRLPPPRWKDSGWWGWWAFQLCALVGACVAFWLITGIPLAQALFNPGGILNPGR